MEISILEVTVQMMGRRTPGHTGGRTDRLTELAKMICLPIPQGIHNYTHVDPCIVLITFYSRCLLKLFVRGFVFC